MCMLLEPFTPQARDLIFGITAPIGTDVEQLTNVLSKELSAYGYRSEVFRLSSFLQFDVFPNLTSEGKSIARLLMDRGDELRISLESGDAAVALAIFRIHAARKKIGDDSTGEKRAWILRTLKHPDEVELLRKVYGSNFVSLSVGEAEESRRESLEQQIRSRSPEITEPEAEASALISRDESSGTEFGQNVRKTNQLADFYLEIGASLVSDAKRMVGLFFGKPFETPSKDEQAMFHAFASALRSSDPGRQVGAVVTNSEGDIICSGTNEVPKPGGGQYWNGDSNDYRDFQFGRDNNKKYLKVVLQEVFDALSEAGVLRSDLLVLNSETRFNKISAEADGELNKKRVSSLIEFGRITHAEMSAITDAARNGRALVGSTIYVTAFPCHMCMRLIIASGISRIVYVEPYPKSLAVNMYGKSLSFEGVESGGRIRVDRFKGASHRVFERLFTMINRERDSDGAFKWFNKSDLTFRNSRSEIEIDSIAAEFRVISAFENRVANVEGVMEMDIRKLVTKAKDI